MKVRLLAAASIAVAAGVAVAPAQATPYAGQFHYLSTRTLAFTGADGARWLLNLGATQSGAVESRSEQKLYIDLSRCAGSACKTVGKWSRPLTANEVSISGEGVPMAASQPATARLRTVLGGVNLDVTLTDDGDLGGAALDSLGTTLSPPGIGPSIEQWQYASGTVKLATLTCRVAHHQGVIGEVEGADTVGDDSRDPRTAPPAHLPAGFLTGKRSASC